MTEKFVEAADHIIHQRDFDTPRGTAGTAVAPARVKRNTTRKSMSVTSQFEESVRAHDYVSDNTQLVIAATCGDFKEVKRLLAKGAEVCTGNFRPFRGAAMNGYLDIIQSFLASGTIPLRVLEAAQTMAENSGETKVVELLQNVIRRKTALLPSPQPTAR